MKLVNCPGFSLQNLSVNVLRYHSGYIIAIQNGRASSRVTLKTRQQLTISNVDKNSCQKCKNVGMLRNAAKIVPLHILLSFAPF